MIEPNEGEKMMAWIAFLALAGIFTILFANFAQAVADYILDDADAEVTDQ